jgi:hypothetical protein
LPAAVSSPNKKKYQGSQKSSPSVRRVNPIDVTPRKGSQHVKKVPIPPQVPLRSTRNLLLEEYVFSMHQIGDLYKDIIVRESVKGRRDIGVHEQ